MHPKVNLSPLRAATKRQGSNGAKMLRKYGEAAHRAARRETGIIPALHADDPMFYYGGTKPAANVGKPRLVKKG